MAGRLSDALSPPPTPTHPTMLSAAAGVDVNGGGASLLWNGSNIYSCVVTPPGKAPGFNELRGCLEWCRDQGATIT